MRIEFCSDEEFLRRIYDHITEKLSIKEGISVEEVRRLVPLESLQERRRLSVYK